ncbi:MAG: DUF7793 family protein, partial [Bacteroidia bacterium]
MEIPANTKTYDMQGSTIWIDEKGIVYSVPKPDAPADQSIEEMEKEMVRLREIIGTQKVCFVLESNKNSKAPPKHQRDFIAEQLSSVTKAMAIITSSPLSRMIANLFFGLKPPPYPVK